MRTRTFLTLLAVFMAACNSTAGDGSPTGLVVAADLQHHRWILESINGEPVVADDFDDTVPELDFGEQMHVSGNTGCNRVSGTAELRGEYFQIPVLAGTRRLCSPARNEMELTMQNVLAQESVIFIDADKNLTLTTDDVVLRFRLRDWVK